MNFEDMAPDHPWFHADETRAFVRLLNERRESAIRGVVSAAREDSLKRFEFLGRMDALGETVKALSPEAS